MLSRPVRRTESHWEAHDGVLLFERAWLPEKAERVVVIVHGLAEHCGRYDAVGAWLARHGCAVHAWDQRGHGRSGGVRMHVERFDELLDDVDAFVARVREVHPGLPLALLGHSMGGLVVASLIERGDVPVDAIVLSAPALGRPRPKGRARFVGLVRRIAPRAHLPIGIDPLDLSRDPEVARSYLEDRLVERRMTASMAAELFGALARIERAGAADGPPMLVIHGAADRICAPGPSQAFAERCGARATLRLLPEVRHEPLNEPEGEAILADILAWTRASLHRQGAA